MVRHTRNLTGDLELGTSADQSENTRRAPAQQVADRAVRLILGRCPPETRQSCLGRREVEGRLCAADLADDFEVVLQIETTLEAETERRVILDDQDPDGVDVAMLAATSRDRASAAAARPPRRMGRHRAGSSGQSAKWSRSASSSSARSGPLSVPTSAPMRTTSTDRTCSA